MINKLFIFKNNETRHYKICGNIKDLHVGILMKMT
jgi:hypothetical protein